MIQRKIFFWRERGKLRSAGRSASGLRSLAQEYSRSKLFWVVRIMPEVGKVLAEGIWHMDYDDLEYVAPVSSTTSFNHTYNITGQEKKKILSFDSSRP